MTVSEIKKDIKTVGAKILGRKLTSEEVRENAEAMVDYFEILLTEDCDGDEEAAYALFNDDFYDYLKEILEK